MRLFQEFKQKSHKYVAAFENAPIDPQCCVERLERGEWSSPKNKALECMIAHKVLGSWDKVAELEAVKKFGEDSLVQMLRLAIKYEKRTRIVEAHPIEITQGELDALNSVEGTLRQKKLMFTYYCLFKSLGKEQIDRLPKWYQIVRAAKVSVHNESDVDFKRIVAKLKKSGLFEYYQRGAEEWEKAMNLSEDELETFDFGELPELGHFVHQKFTIVPSGEVVFRARDIYDIKWENISDEKGKKERKVMYAFKIS